MSQLKTAIITVSFLILVLIGYIYFSYDEAYKLDMAMEEYLRGNNEKAGEVLNRINKSEFTTEKFLYQAYLDRENKNLKDSNTHLQKAEEISKYNTRVNLHLEIFYNQMLNAYLENDPQAMNVAIAKANETLSGQDNDWTLFFKDLQKTLVPSSKNTSQDLYNFKNPKEMIPLTQWMKKSFNSVFNPFWVKTQQINHMIHQGSYVQARQLIEKEMQQSNEEEKDYLNFLQGLTYAKEAESKPYDVAGPYYKLALSYYNKIPFQHEKYAKEKENFLKQINATITKLIENGKYQDLNFYITVLDQFHEKEEIETLSNSLISVVNAQLSDESGSSNETFKNLVILLNQILSQGETKAALQSKLKESLDLAFKEQNITAAARLWDATLVLSDDPQATKDKYAALVTEKILETVNRDGSSLLETKKYLDFWSQIVKAESATEKLSQMLLAKSLELWNSPDDSAKAMNLLVLVRNLPGIAQQELVKKQVQEIYTQTINDGNYTKLPQIYQTLNALNLGVFTLASPEEIEGYTKEAEYLFANQKFENAKNLASWILTVDPKNEKGLVVGGLVDFYRGNYTQAAALLSQIDTKNLEINQALAVSQILAGDKKEGIRLLEELKSKGEAPPNLYIRLGFGELLNNNPQEAVRWFDEIKEENSEAAVGKVVAAFQMKEWDRALQNINALSPAYANIGGIQGLKVLAMKNLNNIDEAKKQIQALLNQPPAETQDDSKYSEPFKQFLQKYLDEFELIHTAAVFANEVENNPEKAFQNLSKIENPTSNTHYIKASTLKKLQKPVEAQKELLKALAKADNNNRNQQIKILRSLATLSAEIGDDIGAFLYFHDYYLLNPKADEYRSEYAKVLVNIGRFDLALNEYKIMVEQKQLQESDYLSYIQTLINSDHFSKANEFAQQWMSRKIKPSTVDQLQLAQLMVVTQNDDLINTVLEQLPKLAVLSVDEVAQLLKLSIYQGELSKALSLAKGNTEKLESTVNGLMALAFYHHFYSDPKTALEYAQKAQILAPEDFSIQEFLVEFQSPDDVTEKIKSFVNVNAADNPLNYEEQLNLFRVLIDYASKANTDAAAFHLSSAIFLLQTELDKLSPKLNDVPEFFYIKGQLYSLLGNPKVSEESFNKAISLNSAYSDALEDLGFQYFSQRELNEARSSLKKAIKYMPYNAEAWYLLGKVDIERGALLDAVEDLQNSIRYKPNNLAPYLLLGKLQIQIKDPEGARKSLEFILKLFPDDIDLLKQLLITLNDPNLKIETTNVEALEEDRKEIYDKLYKISPKDAETLREIFNKFQVPEDSNK